MSAVPNLNMTGVALALEMLGDLEEDKSEAAYLEARVRDGHRNIVAEYLIRARELGPEVESALCAVLSDYVGIACLGARPRP